MCGFIFAKTKKIISDTSLESAARYVSKRGPDATGMERFQSPEFGHLLFAHFLLDISGRSVRQPLIKDGRLVLLFNGEVYNHRDISDRATDTEAILDNFARTPDEALAAVKGEYVILVYETNKNELLIKTDTFLTKPVYLGRGDNPADVGVASYPSALLALGFSEITSLQPNSIYRIKFTTDTLEFQEKFPLRMFNLSQEKSGYKDWDEAFLESIRKRALHGAHKPLVCLSSGYDSGAICLALNQLGIKYQTISVMAGENKKILGERLRQNSKYCDNPVLLPGLTKKQRELVKRNIRTDIERFTYRHRDSLGSLSIEDDSGAQAGYYVAQKAKEMNLRVNLSGSGADEIISDYGFLGKKIFDHSEFGGAFPENIDDIFPWKKFYGDTQRSYLFKEEIVWGGFGIESRYPFLDDDLVQEFLHLKYDLKNKSYKAPIAQFLENRGYPFENGIKRGFRSRKEGLVEKLRNRWRIV